jgi:ferrous iron transport protein B
VLRRVGLHGKSFIPLLSSFACAIPGVLSTKTIESRRERLATVMVAPFMSCSARLPVYALVVGACFAGWSATGKGLLLFALYALGVVAAFGVAWVATFIRGRVRPTPFLLELPIYKVPRPRQVLLHAWMHTWEFIKRAGTIIFALSILIWAITTYPRAPEASVTEVTQRAEAAWVAPEGLPPEAVDDARILAVEEAVAAEHMDHSIAGRLGHLIEPLIAPLGFDWKIGVGLVGSFAAREVFVSTLGITYGIGDPGDETAPLEERMQGETWADGSPVWTSATALSLLVWFVLAMQCISTTAVVKRETGSWRWPIIQILVMNGMAWVACLITYQVASRVLA